MSSEKKEEPHKKFLGVYFVTCGIYGRLYKNDGVNAYIGRCPKCGKPFRIGIHEAKGTEQRFFKAHCR